MGAQLFNLATHRKCRALEEGLASAEAAVAAHGFDLAQLGFDLDDLGIDPRAAGMLAMLRSHFDGLPRMLAEVEHLRLLLRSSRSDAE